MPLSSEQRERLMAYYGLDKPVHVQYRDYFAGLLKGDLGWSIAYNAPVVQVLLGRMRWTLLLVGTATAIYVFLGVVLGSLSAWYHGRPLDSVLLIGASVTGAFPAFFMGLLLIVLFGVTLGWLPLGAAQSPAALSAPPLERTLDIGVHMILPVVALVLSNLGQVYYVTRNSLVQTLGEGYITVARAKGLSEQATLFRHALPNALLPIVSLVALRLGFMVMGAVMVENTFAYPGIGSAVVEASYSRDYPLLQGAFALVTLSIMAANASADALHGILDPRVRRKA